MPRILRLLALAGILCSAGCSSLAPLLSTPTPVPVTQTSAAPQPTSTPNAPQPQARILRIWLPPRFNPESGAEPATLLKQRLAEFEAQHPGLEVEVRIKAEEGETSLLHSLAVTSLAAPTALPDLIALPRPALETAARKGYLHPIDGLSVMLDDPDWYAYARDLGHVQNIGYGLPFAGDAMVLVYRAENEGGAGWSVMFSNEIKLAFPAADPQGSFGLSLYASAGGMFFDANGLPVLERDALTQTLLWLEEGVSAGSIPSTLKNISLEADALALYRSGGADAVIAWTSSMPEGSVVPLPGLDGSPRSPATGWVWALAGSNPENQQVAIELAESLTAGDFMSEWTRAAGYLPTRPSGAIASPDSIVGVLESAWLAPSDDVVMALGPLMQEAWVRVLNGEQPEAVTGSVIEKLR